MYISRIFGPKGLFDYKKNKFKNTRPLSENIRFKPKQDMIRRVNNKIYVKNKSNNEDIVPYFYETWISGIYAVMIKHSEFDFIVEIHEKKADDYLFVCKENDIKTEEIDQSHIFYEVIIKRKNLPHKYYKISITTINDYLNFMHFKNFIGLRFELGIYLLEMMPELTRGMTLDVNKDYKNMIKIIFIILGIKMMYNMFISMRRKADVYNKFALPEHIIETFDNFIEKVYPMAKEFYNDNNEILCIMYENFEKVRENYTVDKVMYEKYQSKEQINKFKIIDSDCNSPKFYTGIRYFLYYLENKEYDKVYEYINNYSCIPELGDMLEKIHDHPECFETVYNLVNEDQLTSNTEMQHVKFHYYCAHMLLTDLDEENEELTIKRKLILNHLLKINKTENTEGEEFYEKAKTLRTNLYFSWYLGNKSIGEKDFDISCDTDTLVKLGRFIKKTNNQ